MKRKASDCAINQIVEWDDVVCPICMEHPHNAVILRCSSYKNGCRSYVCDSGHKHSNCLDRFVEQTTGPKRMHSETNSAFSISPNVASRDSVEPLNISQNVNLNETNSVASSVEIPTTSDDNSLIQNTHLAGGQQPDNSQPSWPQIASEIYNTPISCPMCRGTVSGWEIADEGRRHLNLLKRSCSYDGCSFSGSYRELRQHVRMEHLESNPVRVDPTRVQSWQRLGLQRERDDIVTAIHSETPNAVVLGDYAIEGGDRQIDQDGDEDGPPWLETLFIIHMINTLLPESSRRSRALSRYRRLGGPSSNQRRLLWGENLLGLQDDEIDEDYTMMLNAVNENPPPARRRGRNPTYLELMYDEGNGDHAIDVNAVNDDPPPARRRRRHQNGSNSE